MIEYVLLIQPFEYIHSCVRSSTVNLMASSSKLMQLRTKATEASKFISKNGCAYYKHLMEKNKAYVENPPSVETCTKLAKQLFYTRLAR